MRKNPDSGLDGLEGIESLQEFDPAEHLTTRQAIASYLSAALASGDLEHFKDALNTAARAEGMAKVAAGAGVTREGAYKALKAGSKPQMSTILGLLDALGMTIQVVPKAAGDNSFAVAA